MNFLKKFLGSTPKDEISIIPSGQLFLRRSPGSPKSASECLYTDAVASIRKTSAPHNYLLVVQRAYAEGEEELKGDDDEEADDEFDSFKDEKLSLIDASIRVHKIYRDGSTIVSWNNPEGDEGETFEFVADPTVKDSEVDQFMDTVHACCYERKYNKSSAGVTKAKLEEFEYDPDASEVDDLAINSLSLGKSIGKTNGLFVEEDDDDDDDSIFQDATEGPKAETKDTTKSEKVKGETIGKFKGDLMYYNLEKDSFSLLKADSLILIIETAKWEYALSVNDQEVNIPISSSLGPLFNDKENFFIFVDQDQEISYLLKFKEISEYKNFKESLISSLWESSNKSNWSTNDLFQKTYLLSAFNNIEKDEELTDYFENEQEGSEEESEESDEEQVDQTRYTSLRTGLRKENFSDSEDEEEESKKNYFKGSGNKNLTISYKNNNSYVTRGNKIGVFKTNDDDELEFTTAIENLSIGGKTFNPSKVMLHTEDRSLVMQNDSDKTKLYRMDLERGKIVDEWKVKDDLSVVEFGPSAKFNQMTGEQTFLGISDKGLFKVDPRLSGNKIVEDQYKQYSTKNDFSSFGTTENGYIAVASNKGDVRLYDKLGIRAKSLIPAIGDSIKHVEVSADGKWLLATCQTYLILIDLTIKEGANAGKLGFQKSFGKDNTPKTRMLRISPEHVAHMKLLTKEPLNFSKAHFNTGLNAKEQTIVSSSGPYAITWSLKKIIRGDAEPYMIKRYQSNVVADNFKFGTDKDVIIALEDDVGMVKKKEFRKADRNSLAFTPRRV